MEVIKHPGIVMNFLTEGKNVCQIYFLLTQERVVILHVFFFFYLGVNYSSFLCKSNFISSLYLLTHNFFMCRVYNLRQAKNYTR